MNTKQKYLAIIGIVTGFMAMGLSFSLINANLESIQKALGASVLQLQWIINVYGIFIASTLVAMGRLGDIYGRKKLFLIGMLFFAIAMLGGGLATNAATIIGFQVFWGLAGAILLPLSQALLVDLYPDEKKSTATGIWNCASGISLAIGPIFGGIILNFLSWRWIFLINIPFILIGFILTTLFARESKTEGESKRIDWGGVFALKVAIGAFVLATVQCNCWSLASTFILYGISAAAVIVLLAIEKRVEMPVIRQDLFQNRKFLLFCVQGFCTIGIFWATIFLLPLYLQKQMLLSPFQAGITLLGFAVPIALFSPLSGYLYTKVAPKNLIGFGFFLLAASCAMQLSFKEMSSTLFVGSAIFLLGMGFSLIMTPTLTGAISTISRNFAGLASGTFVTTQEIGGSVGLAVTVMIVRKQEVFHTGFHNGIWIVLALSLIGIFSAILLDLKKAPVEERESSDL